jgi:tRNA threonylcarbamoyl adenosine modification protein YeaZ
VILALDTSGDELVVALVADGRLIAASVHPGGRHQDRVTSVIADLTGEGLARIDAVAVARGPGSHTGLRVGLSTAAGIAFGRRLQVYPLSSLAVAAQRVSSSDASVLALVAAGRGRAYSQAFAGQGSSRIPSGPRRLRSLGDIDAGGAIVAAEPALLAQLSLDAGRSGRGGAEALAAAVNQAVSAKKVVDYDQLTGDYGETKPI